MESALKEFIFQQNQVIRDISDLLLGLGRSSTLLANSKEEMSAAIKQVLFEDEKLLTVNVTKEKVDIIIDNFDMEHTVTEEKKDDEQYSTGCFEVKTTFRKHIFLVNKIKRNGFLIDRFYRLHGMPSYIHIIGALSLFFKNVANSNIIDFVVFSEELEHQFKALLPNLSGLLLEILKPGFSQLNVVKDKEAVYYKLKSSFDNAVLEKKYPGVFAFFDHFSEYTLNLCKMVKDRKTMKTEKSIEYSEIAPSALQIYLEPKKSITSFQIEFAVKDGDCNFLWREHGKDKKDLGKVTGEICDFSLNKGGSFLLSFDIKLRIPQLCGTFRLPKILLSLDYVPRVDNSNFSTNKGWFLKVFHIEKESFLTRLVLRPFLNLAKLHELMESDFVFHVDTYEKLSVSPLQLDAKIPMLIPPKVVTLFMKHFVTKATAQDGLLEFIRDMVISCGTDLKILANKNNKSDQAKMVH